MGYASKMNSSTILNNRSHKLCEPASRTKNMILNIYKHKLRVRDGFDFGGIDLVKVDFMVLYGVLWQPTDITFPRELIEFHSPYLNNSPFIFVRKFTF